jgi:serine-type D-Ala-D-Ala carboxypeptidase (penicillin-binding protein 5/6)
MPTIMRRPNFSVPAVRALTVATVLAGLAGATAGVAGAAAWGRAALPAGPAASSAPAGPAAPPTPAPAVPAPAAPAPPPIPATVTATAFVVADAATGRVLAERAPHQRLRPASTLKVLTALALMPRLDPASVHVSTAGELSTLYADEPGSSAVGVQPGLSYRVSDLWNGVFLRSGNDAIATLAHIAGGVPATLDLMRDTAKRLHANDTVVVNADGYDADGQVSTAYDLALMARAGLQDPGFRSYCGLTRARFPGNANSSYEIDNENRLLGKYPGMIGVKNGYTSLAHHTFVGAAERNGRTLLVTIMDAGIDIYKQTASLLDWGFAQNPGPTVDQLVASEPLPRSVVPQQAASSPASEAPAQQAQNPAKGEGAGQVGASAQGKAAGQTQAPAQPIASAPASNATGSATGSGTGSAARSATTGVPAGTAAHPGTRQPTSDQRPDVALTANRTKPAGATRTALVALGGFLALVLFAVVGLRLRVLRRRRVSQR